METSGFRYLDGQLHCDGMPVSEIADEYGTPLFLYSKETLLRRLAAFREAFSDHDPLICFSVKSLANISILRMMAGAGCGFDIVSGGELYRVLQAGGQPSKTVFAGVGKSRPEIEFALRHNVHMFNVESESEMRLIRRVADELGCRADVAIRVNPDVDAQTHEKTTTGKKENKFGIDIGSARRLAIETKEFSSVVLRGLHVHLGSPIYDTTPYERGLAKIAEFRGQLAEEGIEIDTVNLGGGYCMSYTGEQVPGPASYAEAMAPGLNEMGTDLILEPGRHVAAPAGVFIVRTLHRKTTGDGKTFVIADGAMNDLLRPALYGAFHRIWPAYSSDGMPEVVRPDDDNPGGGDTEKVDIVGPVCESSDCMAKDRAIPRVNEGDLLAIFDTGAYGYTMSSNYNGRPRAAEVLVGANGPVLIARRETYNDLVVREELTAI